MYSPTLPYGGVDPLAPLPDSGIARATQTHVLLQRANYLAAYAYDTSIDERAGIMQHIERLGLHDVCVAAMKYARTIDAQMSQ